MNPVPVEALITTLPPKQNIVDDAATAEAEGHELTTTLTADEVSEHPFKLVTNTRYKPVVVAVKFELTAVGIITLFLSHL